MRHAKQLHHSTIQQITGLGFHLHVDVLDECCYDHGHGVEVVAVGGDGLGLGVHLFLVGSLDYYSVGGVAGTCFLLHFYLVFQLLYRSVMQVLSIL